MWGHGEMAAICKLRGESSGQTNPADTLTSRTVKNTFVLFTPPSVWDFCCGSPSNIKCVCECVCVFTHAHGCRQCEEVIKIWAVSGQAKSSHWVNSKLLSHVVLLPRDGEWKAPPFLILPSIHGALTGLLAPLLSTKEPETILEDLDLNSNCLDWNIHTISG